MRLSVQEVDQESDHQPHDQTNPRITGKTVHHVAADGDRQNRHDRDKRRPERTRQIRALPAKNNDSRGHDDECQERTDRYQLAEQADREKAAITMQTAPVRIVVMYGVRNLG